VKNGGVPQYLAIFTDFSNSKNFYKCFEFSGGQKIFFLQKCPNDGLLALS